jgi:S1-C subfamily serine protease
MNLVLKRRLNKAKKTVESIYKKAEEILFKKLPSSIGTSLAIILGIAPIILAIYMYYLGKNSHPSSYTVMVTNMEGTGGGSGVIVKNTESESVILSNSHVCEGVLKRGGKIRLVNGEEHVVTGYLTDIEHDLCVLTVAADLKNSIKLASKAPKIYSEATITGHPALMPNIITKGHFGGRQIIQIIVGARKCKESDLKDPKIGIFCMFFGIAPIIRDYESQVVSATIMGGSSGSAVLNSDGELSGLVFAGNSIGLSYAYIVPFEYVKNFTQKAIATISSGVKNRPWMSGEGKDSEEEIMSRKKAKALFSQKCSQIKPENIEKTEIINFCQMIMESNE